ncbi:alpha/beta fold hydrolase [Colwellia sp. UCD-KL20]|uniref:alpha/beta fold hydrolase n=1 Tax=Colwellia sp. UCD-KL20 TaxID=1917165 RepID=UPI00097046C9|nr:alpha/beta fold hydrolase [Colwellia sp. UCD-KL20]
MQNELKEFWSQGDFQSFTGKNTITIRYAHFSNKTGSPTVVISSGRSESYLKYKNIIFELHQQGYSIFILDHRGQGLSQRMLSNTHKGYVERFDDYAHDLHQFITSIVNPTSTNSLPYLLAHSMGCAISLRMFQLFPQVVKKAALLSPMIAINTGVLPHFLARFIVNIGRVINHIFSNEPWFFIGLSAYKAKAFHNNQLTHCKKRYKSTINLYEENTNIQLGGVTFHWLSEALKAEHNIFSDLDKIHTPLCIFQAANDNIVDNKKQDIFCDELNQLAPHLSAKSPIVIEGAWHELLFETDEIRTKVLTRALQFLES